MTRAVAVEGQVHGRVLDDLSSRVSLLNADGTTSVLAPLGSPFVIVELGGDGILRPHETKTVKLEFLDPSGVDVTYVTRVVSVTPTP